MFCSDDDKAKQRGDKSKHFTTGKYITTSKGVSYSTFLNPLNPKIKI